MIRSNSKKAIENIKNYIVENSNFSNYEIETPNTFAEIAPVLMHIFYIEKCKNECRRIPYQEQFVDWLQGLPSAFDSCYYYNRSAVNDLGKILEETQEEKSRYSEQKAEETLSRLIWRELFKACKYQVK